ncbi:hypothetical protein QUA62_26705 [Microcoleus sp. MON1_C1]|uniref:hypothetical protein n=1 Tax=Microcoleus sp. MON1_C1 TaxID=2818827 RepID=UPI002FD41779
MGSTTRQLKEQDRELLKFHERVGDLWIKVQSLKEQLEVERSDRKDIEAKYWDKVEALTELQLRAVEADRGEVRSTVPEPEQQPASAEPEQQPAPAIELPDAADTLKKIRKALGKKSTASLADVEKILEIIEGDGNE